MVVMIVHRPHSYLGSFLVFAACRYDHRFMDSISRGPAIQQLTYVPQRDQVRNATTTCCTIANTV